METGILLESGTNELEIWNFVLERIYTVLTLRRCVRS